MVEVLSVNSVNFLFHPKQGQWRKQLALDCETSENKDSGTGFVFVLTILYLQQKSTP